MDTAEILRLLERHPGTFTRTAVEAAVARREEITPELLRILENTLDHAAQLDAEGDYMAHLYAMFCWRSSVRLARTLLWSALPCFRATSWILSVAISSRKTSARSWRRFVAAT